MVIMVIVLMNNIHKKENIKANISIILILTSFSIVNFI
jgi:hypothetical protein